MKKNTFEGGVDRFLFNVGNIKDVRWKILENRNESEYQYR